MVKIQSSDGEMFHINSHDIVHSITLNNIKDNFNLGESETIPLKTVDAVSLRLILKWIDYHKYDDLEKERKMLEMKEIQRNLPWNVKRRKKNEEKGIYEPLNYEKISDWDDQFLNIQQGKNTHRFIN